MYYYLKCNKISDDYIIQQASLITYIVDCTYSGT